MLLRVVITLVHLPNQSVDLLLPISQITALNVVLEFPRPEPTSWVAELERPQEVACLLKIGSHGHNLMDEIFHAHDAILAKVLFDDGVVGKRNALLIDLAVASLVDEFAHGFEVGVPPGYERLNNLQHLEGGFSQADEDAIVDLEETKELQGLALLRVNLVDTASWSVGIAEKVEPDRHTP